MITHVFFMRTESTNFYGDKSFPFVFSSADRLRHHSQQSFTFFLNQIRPFPFDITGGKFLIFVFEGVELCGVVDIVELPDLIEIIASKIRTSEAYLWNKWNHTLFIWSPKRYLGTVENSNDSGLSLFQFTFNVVFKSVTAYKKDGVPYVKSHMLWIMSLFPVALMYIIVVVTFVCTPGLMEEFNWGKDGLRCFESRHVCETIICSER